MKLKTSNSPASLRDRRILAASRRVELLDLLADAAREALHIIMTAPGPVRWEGELSPCELRGHHAWTWADDTSSRQVCDDCGAEREPPVQGPRVIVYPAVVDRWVRGGAA